MKFGCGRPRSCGPGCALTKIIGESPAILGGHDPFVLQVTLVPHQDDLGVVPGVGLDLGGPVEWRVMSKAGRGRGEGEGQGSGLRKTHQSCTAAKDSWLATSYISRKPMAPR